MMGLNIQILTFFVSIIVGTMLSFIIDFCLKLNKFFTFLILMTFAMIYFVLLLKLNNAIIHPYYIIALILGFIIKELVKKIALRLKK